MRRTVLAGLTTLGIAVGGTLAALPAQAVVVPIVVSNSGVKLAPASCTPDSSGAVATYTTISDAVAASGSGDTILVCPGTYHEGVTVPHGLTLWGAQHDVDARTRSNPSAETIVDNGGDTDFDVTSSNVTIDGFTLATSTTGGDTPAVLLESGVDSVLNTIFTGNGRAAKAESTQAVFDQDAYATTGGANAAGISFVGSTASQGTVSNSKLVGNFGAGAIGAFGDAETNIQIGLMVKDNLVDVSAGGYGIVAKSTSQVDIEGNEIDGAAATVNGVRFDDTAQNFSITGNRLTGMSAVGALKFDSTLPVAATVEGTIEQNYFANNEAAIDVENIQALGGLTIDSNVFDRDFGTVGTPGGVTNTSPLTLNAINNFWGCQYGPGADGCDPVKNTGSGAVTSDPYIHVTVIGPSTMVKNSTSTFTAELSENSAGAQVSPAVLDHAVAGQFSFTKGTVNPASADVVNGVANTTLTATTLGDGTATVQVVNATVDLPITVIAGTTPPPPTLPALTIHDASVAEGNSGTHALTFKVTMSKKTTKAVTVHFTTANGSAIAGSDFVAKSGVLTIAKGKTTGSITIMIKGDKAKEPNESFAVNIFNPTNARIADPVGTGIIRNDDH